MKLLLPIQIVWINKKTAFKKFPILYYMKLQILETFDYQSYLLPLINDHFHLFIKTLQFYSSLLIKLLFAGSCASAKSFSVDQQITKLYYQK